MIHSDKITHAISRIVEALKEGIESNELSVFYLVHNHNIYISCTDQSTQSVIDYLYEWQRDIDYISKSMDVFKVHIKGNKIILKA